MTFAEKNGAGGWFVLGAAWILLGLFGLRFWSQMETFRKRLFGINPNSYMNFRDRRVWQQRIGIVTIVLGAAAVIVGVALLCLPSRP